MQVFCFDETDKVCCMGGYLKISYYYAEMLRVCSEVYKIPVCFPETVRWLV